MALILPFIAIATTHDKVTVFVDDLHESSCDVAFEAKIMRTYDKAHNQGGQNSNVVYVHYDLLNKKGYTTLTLSLIIPSIEEHEQKLKVGIASRLRTLGFKINLQNDLRKVTCQL